MITQQGGLYRIPDREATANHLYGAVDLGSNTFRLLIARVINGRCVPVLKTMQTVRLGEALHRTGRISDQAFSRGKASLADFKTLLDRHQPKRVRVCGTAALRTAANSERFLQDATAILGVDAEIIDGEEEAQLSGIGALAAMKTVPTTPLLLADIGGGSSELLTSAAPLPWPTIKSALSLPLGAVTLSETFLRAALPTAEELAAMAAHIKAVLTPVVAAMTPWPEMLLGIGGTATALAAMDCNLTKYDSDRIQDYSLPLANLKNMLTRLSGMSAPERNRLPGMDDGRGEIVVGGLMVFITLLELLSFPAFTVSDGGLLEGILLSIATDSYQN